MTRGMNDVGGLGARRKPRFRVRFLLWAAALILLITSSLRAQPNPDTLWTRVYDGAEGYRVIRASTGGYLIVGETEWRPDALLIRIDEDGNVIWQRTYGWTGTTDALFDCAETPDGGFVAVGSRLGGLVLPNIENFVVKVDAAGDTLWTRTFGFTDSTHDGLQGVLVESDGRIVCAGGARHEDSTYTAYDITLYQLSPDGDLIWSRRIGGPGPEAGYALARTADGDMIAAQVGNPDVDPQTRIRMVATSAAGDSLWSRDYDSGDPFMFLGKVHSTSDGGFVVCGSSRDLRYSENKLYVLRLASSGDERWSRNGLLENSIAYDVIETTDGSVIICGVAGRPEESIDATLLKFTASGDTLWSRRYGSGDDWASSVVESPEHSYAITGFSLGGGVMPAGVFTVKTGPDVTAAADIPPVPRAADLQLFCYPNPFNSAVQIRLFWSGVARPDIGVYDLTGRLVKHWNVVAQDPRGLIQWTPSGLASGTYIVRASSGLSQEAQQIIYMKLAALCRVVHNFVVQQERSTTCAGSDWQRWKGSSATG